MRQIPHLLVVDDDRGIRELLGDLLPKRGFKVTAVRDEPEMRRVLASAEVDLIILDVMLPGRDGLSICRDLRATERTPIVMLTARGDPVDRVVGLEMGADDYLPKPFDLRELEARVRAVLRRSGQDNGPTGSERGKALGFSGWKLEVQQRQLSSPEGMIVELTSGEFDVLMAFAERPQRILSREQLIDIARGRDATPFDRSIDVQISRLRRKIEDDPKLPILIKTVRGGGYLFTPAVERL
jgi:two-component system, OmpR family, response regulator